MANRRQKSWYYQPKSRSRHPVASAKKAPIRAKKSPRPIKGKKSKKRKAPRWKKVLKVTGYVFLALAIFVAAVFLWFAKDLPSSEEILSGRLVDQATQIYDRSGEHLLYEIHGDENRILVDMNDLPEYIPQATIAIEDDAFYRHPGFDVKGITRAAWKNLLGQKYAQGGSTITQQLIKNTILTSEKTFTRKMKELVLSVELEMKLTKDEILGLYLNAIPYGSTAYGIEAASQTYFSKPAKDLSLAEATMLAGLPQAPTYYSPVLHPERAKNRQEVVLDRMAEEGYITESEAEEAKEEELDIVVKRANIDAPHFVDYIREVLVEKYGIKKVETGGLKVITTLDYDKQGIAEEVIAENRDKNLKTGAHNEALVSVDVQTGQILAMVGSVDYFSQEEDGKLDGQVNVITSLRSPGSSIKPLDYVTAFSRGYPPTTIVYDLRTSFGDDGSGGEYVPQNYTGGFSGPVSMRTALQQSLNIPAIKAYYLAGAENVSTMASKFGYEGWVAGKQYGLATAIGGKEVTPLDHVGMFQVFANRGIHQEPTGVLEVIDPTGEVLEEYQDSDERVLEENLADTMSDVLSDNNARSWGRRELVLSDRQVAAKTGTSNKEVGNSIKPDNVWTCGYTPQIATVVWVGNNDGSVMSGNATGLSNASPIWQEYMNRAHEGMPVEEFVKPKPIEAKKPILLGRTAGETEVEICKPSGLLANEYCPESMREKKKFRDVHCILYYVNRLDPNGSVPKKPSEDPQFRSWEGAVRGWAENKEFGAEPPTETDTMHNPEFWPSISITSPTAGTTITSGILPVAANVSGTHKIKEVTYLVDGKKVGSSSNSPFGAELVIPSGITNGFHKLTAIVYDEIDNKAETNIDLNFKVTNIKPTVNMVSPTSGNPTPPGSAVIVSANAQGTPEIERVEFFVQGPDGNVTSLGGDSSADEGNIYGMSWNAASTPGTYYLFAKATDSNDNIAQSSKVSVTIN
ncbi:penicillin-binding protein [Patescibacteria group bacterium]